MTVDKAQTGNPAPLHLAGEAATPPSAASGPALRWAPALPLSLQQPRREQRSAFSCPRAHANVTARHSGHAQPWHEGVTLATRCLTTTLTKRKGNNERARISESKTKTNAKAQHNACIRLHTAHESNGRAVSTQGVAVPAPGRGRSLWG